MMKTAVLPTNKGNLPAESLWKAIFYHNNYILILSALMLGASGIAGNLLPLGAVFFSVIKGKTGKKTLIAAAVILGAAIGGSLERVYINAACMLLFSVFCKPFKDGSPKKEITSAVLLFVSVIIPRIVLTGLQGFLLYDIVKALISSVISFVLYFIFNYSAPIITGTVKKGRFTDEEAVSIAATVILIFSGVGLIRILDFTVNNVIYTIILLIFSYSCGAGAGAAAGAALGLLLSISGNSAPTVIGAFALYGILGGMLSRFGKAGTSSGLLIGNVIMAVYLNGPVETTLRFNEIAVALIIFMFLPKKWIRKLTRPFETDTVKEGGKNYYLRIKDFTAEKLQRFSKVFLDISKTFGEMAEAEVYAGKQDINILFDRVADRVCSSCGLCVHCWDRNFYDTYQVMFKIVERLEVSGRVEESDIPAGFLEKCARIDEFVNTVNNMYELFRVGVVWKTKLSESRGVISRQFEGMARLIREMAGEINAEIRFMKPEEDNIKASLENAGIKVKDVMVYKNARDKYSVSLVHSTCGGARKCISVIEKVVSESLGRKMVRESDDCCKDREGNCIIKFEEAETLKLTTGIARLPQYGSTVSGDNFSFMNNDDGKYTLVLSDGMGSGYEASSQSKAVVDMLESFLESGFDKDMAVDLVNSVLVLKSSDDTTCTIDMTVIDLFNGRTEFVKIGAAPTYIKKGDKVDIIRAATLPAGILPGIDAELAHRVVEAGDMVIMVTDGVIDSFAGDDPGDRQLMRFIQQMEIMNPQQVADSILAEANSRCGGKPCDDLTVLAAKVWRKLK